MKYIVLQFLIKKSVDIKKTRVAFLKLCDKQIIGVFNYLKNEIS